MAVTVADLKALFPDLGQDAHRAPQELDDQTPALSREVLDAIRSLIVGGASPR